MIEGHAPLVRLAPAPEGPRDKARVWPLAGRRDLWFDEVHQCRFGAPARPVGAADLDPSILARLSAPRPPLCGLSLDRPRIMAILNVTPDSFSDGGELDSLAAVVARAQRVAAAADILDIGGESTRPGAGVVSLSQEIARVVPAIRAIREAGITTPISIDTRNAGVAAAALDAGAVMVNDVSALRHDAEMAALVAERKVPLCLMHSQGEPATMQLDPRYDDVLVEVFDMLAGQVAQARQAGIAAEALIVDPGIGFGKTVQHNLILLRQISLFHDLGLPVLLGVSRKRFIGTLAKARGGGGEDPHDRVAGSIAVALHAVRQGIQVLRVHDAVATRQALNLQAAVSGAIDDDA